MTRKLPKSKGGLTCLICLYAYPLLDVTPLVRWWCPHCGYDNNVCAEGCPPAQT